MERIVRHALQQVLDYRHGKGRFNLSHLNFYERDNAAHDLWQEVEDDLRQAIKIIETNNQSDKDKIASHGMDVKRSFRPLIKD